MEKVRWRGAMREKGMGVEGERQHPTTFLSLTETQSYETFYEYSSKSVSRFPVLLLLSRPHYAPYRSPIPLP